ncbi:hypothetical protein [Nocardioides lijunqiniae]|uniref:hypothetical protein n=1 Tax=Nocardioides lijunqiniae TaxID=2760832 RepID=UPI00187895D6|nr:hypothetical protein [Nocardioides lijunqiniae]
MSSSQHDFDFVLGRWSVRNRKLVDVTDPDCDEWVEFDATSVVAPVLGGIGHVDQMSVPTPADSAPPFEAITLRLFDPTDGTWRIWWSSTRAPGVLDTPVVGRFDGTHGVFEAVDTVAGRPTLVRFDWFAEDPDLPRWQQSFSYDGGTTWALNWQMFFHRG